MCAVHLFRNLPQRVQSILPSGDKLPCHVRTMPLTATALATTLATAAVAAAAVASATFPTANAALSAITPVASAAFSSTVSTSVASAASPSTFSSTSVAAAERPAAASAGTPGLHVPLLKHLRLLGLEWGMQRWRAGIRRRVRAVRARHGLRRLRSATC